MSNDDFDFVITKVPKKKQEAKSNSVPLPILILLAYLALLAVFAIAKPQLDSVGVPVNVEQQR